MTKRPKDSGIPKDGVRWPLYMLSAAVTVMTDQGDLGCRCLLTHRIAPDADTARDWFIAEMRKCLIKFFIMDLSVSELPLEALQMAYGIQQAAQQEQPV